MGGEHPVKYAGSNKNKRKPDVRAAVEGLADKSREAVSRIIPAIVLFLGMVALPIIAQSTWQYLATSPVFVLTDIEIEGNEGLRTEDVLNIAKVYAGENLLDTDVSGIRHELMATGWVQTLEIKKELPDTLRIIIKEHVAAATLLSGGLSMIDENGRIFRTVSAGENIPRPVITGIRNPDDPQQGRLLERALAIRGLYAQAGLNEFDQLAEISHNYARGFSMTTEEYRMVAHLGHKDHNQSIRRLRFAVHDAIDRGLGVPLAVHADLGPDRLVILPSKKPRNLPSKLAWRDDTTLRKKPSVEIQGKAAHSRKRTQRADRKGQPATQHATER